MIQKAGFGGGCHWCTEAVFSSLKGIISVQQGWIASDQENDWFSEGVIVEFDDTIISLPILVEIHLYTHSSMALHSMRSKYRSAVYTFNGSDITVIKDAIYTIQKNFENRIITAIIPYKSFKINRDESLNYYFSDPSRPFCENYINPKLQLIMRQFSKFANLDKLGFAE